MNYQLITTNEQLNTVCYAMSQQTALALDTEFVRTRTYYPQVGLIQLFDGQQVALIDPLAISEWQPFIQLLENQSVTKFLHASSEDLELLLHKFSVLPTSLIDTQILAAFLGHPMSWGFAAMVKHYSQVTLDKSEVRTNWLARPLTEKQCCYAAADVTYLLPIAHILVEQCKTAGVFSAAQDECRLLCERRLTILSAKEAWRDIANYWQLKTRQFTALQQLATWRITIARSQDIAVNFVVREANLWRLARYLPHSCNEFTQLGIDSREIRLYGMEIAAIIAKVKMLVDNQLSPPPVYLAHRADYQQTYRAIKAKIKKISSKSGLSQELLASRRQINQLLNYHWKLSPTDSLPELLTGWRSQLMQAEINLILHEH